MDIWEAHTAPHRGTFVRHWDERRLGGIVHSGQDPREDYLPARGRLSGQGKVQHFCPVLIPTLPVIAVQRN